MRTNCALPKDVFTFSARPRHVALEFPFAFGESGVHEVCEAAYGDMPSLLGFSLALSPPKKGCSFYVQQAQFVREHGAVFQAGKCQFVSPDQVFIAAQPRRLQDALWVIEEAVKSAAVGRVIAEIESCDFTSSRRLALASERYGIPIILLMPYHCEGASAAATRWRVQPQLSSDNPYDAHAIGQTRWRAVLERARRAPHCVDQVFALEWNDETLSLTMVSGLAPDPVEACPTPPEPIPIQSDKTEEEFSAVA